MKEEKKFVFVDQDRGLETTNEDVESQAKSELNYHDLYT